MRRRQYPDLQRLPYLCLQAENSVCKLDETPSASESIWDAKKHGSMWYQK